MKKLLVILFCWSLIFNSCKKEPLSTYLTLHFTHTIDGIPLDLTTGADLPYINAEQQKYNIKKIQYLISNISMHTEQGRKYFSEVHFVDADDPSTLTLDLGQLYGGLWMNLEFTIGLNDYLNTSNAYINEGFHSEMVWPEMLGGGYHYMKIEGNFDNNNTFYNIHTGPTPFYFNPNDSSMVSNDWSINIGGNCPNFDNFVFNVDGGLGDVDVTLNMELSHWFDVENILTSNEIIQDVNMQILLQNSGFCIFSNFVNYE